MQNGWIKLHRKLENNPVYSNANMLKLWIHCLLKATHSERQQLIGNQIVRLKKGEFVTGRDSLCQEFNLGVKASERVSAVSLWRWMKKFEEWQMLNIKSTTKYSVISIINWSDYQQDEQQVNSKRTTNEQQVITNKNVKNEKKKELSIQQAELFDSWWNLYGNKKGKVKCEAKFKQLLKKYNYSVIESGTKRYLNHLENLKSSGEFAPQQKNPLTFLNGEHFNDEYEIKQTTTELTSYKPVNFDFNRGEN